MGLLYVAFIFLAAGVIAVPIASRLGLGSVLGYLIAGALIGPFVLGLVKDAEQIMHFAEFGVVMMLFLIGLELQPSVLWKMRNPIIGLGGLQVITTTLFITAIAWSFDQSWQSSLAIGLILSLSSTAIALQIFAEKNLMKSEAGRSGFAVLLFQDIAVIPIIALLPLLAIGVHNASTVDAHGDNLISHLPAWQHTLVVIAVIFAIVIAGRYLMRPVFRFIAQSGLREMFTATALLLVIGIALLMNLVGLSPALGTFVAGVVLANSEYRHELEANIDPFKALLLGLFFMSVGAGIDFGLPGEFPLLIGSIVTGLVVVKLVILLVLSAVFSIGGGNRYWFSFALAQGGEFGFVLLSFATQNRVLEKSVVDLMTASIALSMVLTPVLIVLNEKIIQPRFQRVEEPDMDEISDSQHQPVIIAGFGRFGQIVGRLLLANGIPVTVLDISVSTIERVREFGYTVFYGDACREDLLRTAGAGEASLLIVAIDDRDMINTVTSTSKHHFPDLPVFARAYDVLHYHELQSAGADYIERELFLASLKVGEQALRQLGFRSYQARRKTLQFSAHDRQTIDELGKVRTDRKRYIDQSKQAREEVLRILKAEREDSQTIVDDAWEHAPDIHERSSNPDSQD